MYCNEKKEFSSPIYVMRLSGCDKQFRSYETFYVRYYLSLYDLKRALLKLKDSNLIEEYEDVRIHISKTYNLPSIIFNSEVLKDELDNIQD